MAIVAMKKVRVVALKDVRKKVLSFLQQASVFEFVSSDTSSENDSTDLRKTEKIVADLDFAIRFLKDFAVNNKGFSYALMGEKEVYSSFQVQELAHSFNYSAVINAAQDLEEQKAHISARISEIEKEKRYLSALQGLDANPQDYKQSKNVSAYFGQMKTAMFSLLEEELNNVSNCIELIVLTQTEVETVFFLIYHTEVKADILSVIRGREVLELIIPEGVENMSQYLSVLQEELHVFQEKLSSLNKEITALAANLPQLKACFDYFTWEKECAEVNVQAVSTDYTVQFQGWVAAKKFLQLNKELEKTFDASATLVELETEETDDIPVEIESNKVVAPFEVITRMYGLPRVSELDPTPYLAVFFLVFFGFCLTDTLYGLLLAAICYSALIFMKVPRDMKGILHLVGVGGLSTAALGIVFGGYAGIPVSVLPEFLQNLQQFDTSNSDDIISIMILTFGLGAFQLWFGTIIAGMHTWKTSISESIAKHFSWTLFFIAIAVSQFMIQDEQVAKYTLYSAIGLMALAQAHDTKNIFMKLIMGPFNLIQELIGWGSGILSYARLFALGLATGVIATVFNQIATILSSMLPDFIGIPLMIIIILFGHTLNIAINVLGAFIHSARLQFVEFFGKFMEGGGRRFNPLSRKSTYVYLEQ